MSNITYVTGNYGKYISVKEKFERYGIKIDYANIDIQESEINDIKIISKEKAKIAFEQINSPVFVIDCGFYIKNYPNNPYYPGAFVKRSGVANNIDKVLRDMENIEDRSCYFLDCLTYYDGEDFVQFYGKSEGTLSKEKRGDELKKAKSNLWYLFVPKNCDKTLAQMTDDERMSRQDERTDATLDFINWIKSNQKNKEKILIKKSNENQHFFLFMLFLLFLSIDKMG